MKACSHCRLEKPPSAFHKDRRSKDGLCRKCKSCVSIYQEQWREREREVITAKKSEKAKANRQAETARHRAWAQRNREANIAYHRDWHLRRKYNLSAAEWDAMFEAQGRVCAICADTAPHNPNGWHTDHCHATGHVRGILCGPCNMAIGNIKDSPETALKLYSYLSGKSVVATLLAARDVEEPTSPSVATDSPFGI